MTFGRGVCPSLVHIPATRYPDGPILRSLSDLGLSDSSREDLVHLSNARVAIADYGLLQHDFPELRTERLLEQLPSVSTLDDVARREALQTMIDNWLIANAAMVSAVQAAQEVVNTRIPVDGVLSRGYRPWAYGRATVVPVRCTLPSKTRNATVSGPCGLLDLKGVGVAPDKTPSFEPASDGLFALEYALREYLMQRVVDAIFAREAPTLWTVPTYATLTLGFGLQGGWRGSPAGMHVRRAHRRPRPNDSPDPSRHQFRLAVELLLRSYGITTTNPSAWLEIYEDHGRVLISGRDLSIQPLSLSETGLCMALKGDSRYLKVECSGVQIAGDVFYPPPSGLVVDFGTVYVRPSFDHPMALDARISMNLLRPGTPGFVQPDPRKALPIDIWEPRKVKAHCRNLAREFTRCEISSTELRWKLEAPLRSLVESWSSS